MGQTIRLTARDLDTLCWINQFGFVAFDQLVHKLAVSSKRVYKILKRLSDANYLIREKIFYGRSSVFRLTSKGALVSGSKLPPLKSVPLENYQHDLTVIDLSCSLIERFGGQFITEREIKHESPKGIGRLSDGDLLFQDKRIAIEVELTQKSLRRIKGIVQSYLKNFHYDGVWFFCENEAIKKQIQNVMGKTDFIQVHMLKPFLEGL